MSSRTNGKRTLVRDMLVSQLAFAALMGAIAIGSVLWVSNWVVRDNLDDWAVRWVGEMESLGAGFFLDRSDEGFLELSRYLSRFPEIEYVRYYDLDGKVVYLESAAETPRLYPSLTAADFPLLASSAAGESRHRMDLSRDPLVRISQAVTRESIVSANLFSAQQLNELASEATVVGFVELGLDYGAYDRDLLGGVAAGSAVLTLAFLALLLVGRMTLRRAVRPLVEMQQPLGRIAQGELDVQIPDSVHSEIAAVGEALKTALANIRERDAHLTRLANFDPLTGLAARYHFIEELGSRLEENASGALFFIDLDQFKHVNDTYGHDAGDEVLAQIGGRLKQLVRRGDLLGRFGGDEFILFVSDIGAVDAMAVADKILQDMGEFPLVFEGQSFSANCSLGFALVDEQSALSPETLISQADVACRQAKSLGRNRACRFEPDEKQIESIRSDVQWQHKLKQALKADGSQDKQGGLLLHYQPIERLTDGAIRHYEVLVRLEEDGELYRPDQFLPAAVRFGLMCEVDRWVIGASIRKLAEVRRQDPETSFAVNLSGSAFTDGRLAEFVLGQLEQHGVPASALMFEITEQVAVGSFSEAVPQIRRLMEAGCTFAVDDFGTGYSSLSYLKRLPVQYIKIDGSFIQRLAVSRVDQSIVRAIADIARIMGKQTIAEFVGDEATRQIIREFGIDYAQGYLIGKPGPDPVPQGESARVVPITDARRAG